MASGCCIGQCSSRHSYARIFIETFKIITENWTNLDVLWQDRSVSQSVQSLSRVRLFATPWTAACQASLSITNSQSLLKLMSIEPVMPSTYLILCRSLLLSPSVFPSIRVFSNESSISGGQSIGASASTEFPQWDMFLKNEWNACVSTWRISQYWAKKEIWVA